MAKRKRDEQKASIAASKLPRTSLTNGARNRPASVQIITGSYERVLHGFVATLEPDCIHKARLDGGGGGGSTVCQHVTFSDTFLFAAHSSAIRCLALSHHKESHKCILATGGSDERINLYSIATSPPDDSAQQQPHLPSLSGAAILENPRNKELGSLMHHARPITRLHFPTPGKLFSAGEDNTIAIARSRDWTVLSAMKAPVPKPIGRPSGDTAGPGEVPAGVNDFAIHPSMKVMMTVGKGEKCMRLWNLVTGKKAGALNYGKALLRQVGEGRFGAGEGQKVLWLPSGKLESQGGLVVCFERRAAVFGDDCEPKAILSPPTLTKLIDLQQIPAHTSDAKSRLVAVSTEDGRVLLFDLDSDVSGEGDDLPVMKPFAQIGGRDVDASSRVKSFAFVACPSELDGAALLCITGSSDGGSRIWALDEKELDPTATEGTEPVVKQVGALLATHQSANRITCLSAFVMDGTAHASDAGGQPEEEFGGFSSDDQQSS